LGLACRAAAFRATLNLPRGAEQAAVQEAALADNRVRRRVNGARPRNAIFVLEKLPNLSVQEG
jgi:hypothetical protein